MLTRNTSCLFAALAALGVGGAEIASAQGIAGGVQLEAPLQLASLEWWVVSNDVIVRGVVVDVAADQGNWNIVTLKVSDTLKGTKTNSIKFIVHKFEKTDAALAEAKQSKAEMLWVLKSQKSGIPGEAPNREKTLARNKIDLHAPFVPGRPGEPALPVIPLGPNADAGLKFLTLELKVVQTSDQLIKAIKTTIAESSDVCPCEAEPLRSYVVAIPKATAERTGFSRGQNHLVAPVDRRLEEFARKLVLVPGSFFAAEANSTGKLGERQMMRLEGVKALRLFPTEKNLAITRAWLDAPSSHENFKSDAVNLVPNAPTTGQADKVVLPTELARVPEIHFQKPLTKTMSTPEAQLHTAITIDGVHLLNQKKTDAYIETLMKNRPDLSGLPFVMGEKCRMKPEAGRKFAAALDVFRKIESVILSTSPQRPTNEPPAEDARLMGQYRNQIKYKEISPSASVAALMQVLGHEDVTTRRDLVEYLAEMPDADATRSLARLAIFSTEAEVRGAALKSLKMRRDQDYTDVLLTGLKYPWPAVAQNASEAIVALGRNDLIPQLIDVLDKPDPRAPQVQEMGGKKVTVVRELVRLNHHHNCLLCHAPAPRETTKAEAANLEGLTAQVPVPSESMVAYYRPSLPDILVRFDVTYLRQDFSMKLPVANAEPWPEMQRYDFLVRVREVSDKEARAYQELLEANRPEASPYRRAAHAALRGLTGNDVEPTAAAWRKSTGL